uniref:Uncharacterized protein n=1 Tax=Panagrolaimus superbus TaxID=310955 RepID=A0A914YLB6_9BILA
MMRQHFVTLLDVLTSLRNLRDNQDTTAVNFFDPLKECKCDPACTETTIDTTVSYAKFPMNKYVVLNSPSATQEFSCTKNTNFATSAECINWYSENSAAVGIFFDGLDYNSYVETPSYTISQALNELGGQMGFWLGVSIISLIEFIGLAAVLCMWCIHGKNVKIGPSEEEIENDDRIKHVKGLKSELDAHDTVDERLRHRALMRQDEAAEAAAKNQSD